jgi:hypothetical protein
MSKPYYEINPARCSDCGEKGTDRLLVSTDTPKMGLSVLSDSVPVG